MVLDILYEPPDPPSDSDWEKYVREKFRVTGDPVPAEVVKVTRVK